MISFSASSPRLTRQAAFKRQRPGGFDLRFEVGEHVGDRLEAADRPAELLPLLGVAHRHVEGAARAAAIAGRGDHALGLQAGQDAFPALVLAADQPVGRNARVVEIKLKGADRTAAEHVEPADFKTGRVVVDQKQRHALPVMRLGIGLHVDVDDVVFARRRQSPRSFGR